MSERKRVLFLGAGASAPFGYPVTDRILAKIVDAIQPGADRSQRPSWLDDIEDRHPEICTEVCQGLELLLPGWRCGVDPCTASIIDVLSILDYMIGAQLSLTQEFREADLRKLRHQLAIFMNGVLRGQSELHIRNSLRDWMLEKSRSSGRVSLITTNYDCLYDIPLAESVATMGLSALEVMDLGTTVLDPNSKEYFRPSDARLAVFKLHGSLNWLQCEVCGSLYVNPDQRILTLAFWQEATLYNTCKCGGWLREILVAPSLIRDIRNPHLLSIWNAALSDLREASEWIFIGYSLPQEDIAIRTLLLRALHGRDETDLKVRVALLDKGEQRARAKDKSALAPPTPVDLYDEQVADKTLQRYRDFLPRECFNADRDDYFPGGVEEIVEHLAKNA